MTEQPKGKLVKKLETICPNCKHPRNFLIVVNSDMEIDEVG